MHLVNPYAGVNSQNNAYYQKLSFCLLLKHQTYSCNFSMFLHSMYTNYQMTSVKVVVHYTPCMYSYFRANQYTLVNYNTDFMFIIGVMSIMQGIILEYFDNACLIETKMGIHDRIKVADSSIYFHCIIQFLIKCSL